MLGVLILIYDSFKVIGFQSAVSFVEIAQFVFIEKFMDPVNDS